MGNRGEESANCRGKRSQFGAYHKMKIISSFCLQIQDAFFWISDYFRSPRKKKANLLLDTGSHGVQPNNRSRKLLFICFSLPFTGLIAEGY